MDVLTAFKDFSESQKKELEEKAKAIENLNKAKTAVEDEIDETNTGENTNETADNSAESEG